MSIFTIDGLPNIKFGRFGIKDQAIEVKKKRFNFHNETYSNPLLMSVRVLNKKDGSFKAAVLYFANKQVNYR